MRSTGIRGYVIGSQIGSWNYCYFFFFIVALVLWCIMPFLHGPGIAFYYFFRPKDKNYRGTNTNETNLTHFVLHMTSSFQTRFCLNLWILKE